MKERPILFSAPMVRAILEGRKTQTRRIVKPQPTIVPVKSPRPGLLDGHGFTVEGKYGKPGDRLWVRETFLIDDIFYERGPLPKTAPPGWQEAFYYRADGECCDQIPECACAEYDGKTPWRPSIFMPRWASRITLEITDVRVERLQDISAEDAWEEGCWPPGKPHRCGDPQQTIDAFHELWESINGPDSWDANPWVWAISFTRITS